MSKLRIFLVDDHAILREGIKALIDAQSDMVVVGEAADGVDAVAGAIGSVPDVVVMDISMPRQNGADATAQIRERLPQTRVIALTAHEESEYVQRLLSAGASGFVLKRAVAADLIAGIRAVAGGGVCLDTSMAAVSSAPASVRCPAEPVVAARSILSEREAEVMRLIALGFTMKKIATDLDLSPRTLETYKSRAMSKLSLVNRADVVRYALQQGWLKDG